MATRNTIEFVGKFAPFKESDKFKPFEEKLFEKSGWINRSFKFSMVCGTNRHMMSIKAGKWDDDTESKLYLWSKPVYDESGKEIKKSESFEIPWADRFKAEKIALTADYMKYVVDLELPGRRYKLEQAVEKFKNGTITDEIMDGLGVHTLEEAETELAKSKKKRKDFLSAWDFAEYMQKVVNDEKLKDKMFRVRGEYQIEYAEKTQQFYRSFVPTRVYLADINAEPMSEGTFDFYFNKDAIDDNDWETTKKYHINGYLRFYSGTYKDNKGDFGCPISFTIDGNRSVKTDKGMIDGTVFAKRFVKKFAFPETDNEFRQIGLKVDILDGAQKVEFDISMLDDEQREDLECGLITLDEIKKELGADVYGERVTDLVISGLSKGYTLKGAQDSAFTVDDFRPPHPADNADEDEDKIFNDDDLDI